MQRTTESAREEIGVLLGGLPALVLYVLLVAVEIYPPTAG